ncbi:unnamed protein product [Lasius platythorax]|uniref:Uncharacterized protein n=1 Tax=Lasius platythorax TaxID=488582 RepID=A0AAV2P5A4_9HYME
MEGERKTRGSRGRGERMTREREYGVLNREERRVDEAEVSESLQPRLSERWVKRVYHLFTTRPQTADKNINVEWR